MPFEAFFPGPARVLGVALGLSALALSGAARADGTPAEGSAVNAKEAPITPDQMKAEARAYYDSEMSSAYLFFAYGAVTGGAGGFALTQSGDFAKGFGGSTLILGGLTAIGGIGYGVAVKIRGNHYTGLADTDLAQYHREESAHIAGTDGRFWLYLGTELLEAAAGLGLATYGVAAKNDLYKGIGIGTAIQGIGLFVIDVPGAVRASKYREQLRRFNPGVSVGGNGRPWAATLGTTF